MAQKSLIERIDDLIHALGRAEKPTPAQIRNDLYAIKRLAKKLQNGQSLAEKDARIADFEAELGNLNVLLERANSEIKRFREEQKEREKKEREIPDIQFEILECLPSEQSGLWFVIEEVARAIGRPVDETEVHLKRLKKRELVVSMINTYNALVWHRSDDGNEWVLAKSLAGDEKTKKTHKYPDLPHPQHEALATLIPGGVSEEEIACVLEKTMSSIRHTMRLLKGAGMAIDINDQDGPTGYGRCWSLMEKGEEYLAERDLL